MSFTKSFKKTITSNISGEVINSILENVAIKKYDKGENILRGFDKKATKYYYFVNKGIVRSYTTDKSGSIRVKGFFMKNQMFCSLNALLNKKNDNIVFDCLENNTEILQLDFEKYKKCAKQNIAVANHYINFLSEALTFRENRINDLVTLDSTERYLKLRSEFPEIESSVTQYNIASFLNITPVQLSRVRRNLLNK